MNPQNNVYTPRRSVDIHREETVTAPNGSGWVTRPTWEPSAGKRRQEQIEDARLEALAEQEAQAAAEHPHLQRILKLEAEVMNLKDHVKRMNKTFNEVLTSAQK